MKKLLLAILSILSLTGTTFAAEVSDAENIPVRYREASAEPGYTAYSSDGNTALVNEYSKSRSSAFLKLMFNDLSPQNKFITSAVINEGQLTDLDLHWYHRDKMRLEASQTELYHALPHSQLLVNPGVYELKPWDRYYLDVTRRNLNIKIKPFDFPVHLTLFAESWDKDGMTEKIFYGSRSYDPWINALPSAVRGFSYSTSRFLETESRTMGASVDGVLGGVGFYVSGETGNYQNKQQNTPDFTAYYPVINSSAFTVKLNGSPVGQVSWAASYTHRESSNQNMDISNRDKGPTSSYNITAASLSYNPVKELKFNLKLKYEDRNEDNGQAFWYRGESYVLYKEAVSYIRKTAELTGRYNFAQSWSAFMSLKTVQTDNTDNEYLLPDYKVVNTGVVGVEGRPFKALKLRFSHKIERDREPSYPGTPDRLTQTKLNVAYDFTDKIGVDLTGEYNQAGLNENTERNATESFFKKSRDYSTMINFWATPAEDLSLNAYGSATYRKYDTDIHHGAVTPAVISADTPYRAATFQAGVNLTKNIGRRNTLYTDVYYLRGYGTYTPYYMRGSTRFAGTPPITYVYNTYDLDRIASVNFFQYGLLVGDKFAFTDKSSLKCELGYKDHIEKTIEPLGGRVKTVFISWEQKW